MLERFRRATAAVALCAVPCLAFADELADKGRAILEKNKAGVVTVRIVIKMQMTMQNFPSREEEMKSEATGTVIDPSGLTVLSLNETDPSGLFEDMTDSREGFEVKSSIGDLKILRGDGTEIAAQVVLRDRDLDLAFIRPTEAPKEPLPAVDFANAAAPAMLDPIVTINRMGRVAGREYAVSLERVSAVVTRPRTFYVMGHDPTQTSLGCPAFNLDGAAIGLCVMRSIKRGGDSGGFGMFGVGDDNVMAIVVPAADVLDVAKQAPAAGEEAKELGAEPKEEKTEEKAPEEKAPEEKTDGTIDVKPDAPKA